MKIRGDYRIEAARPAVWQAINDPDVLAQCIPGCEEIVRETPTDWTAKVVARVGPVKARFSGRIRLEDLDPPSACRIVGEGSAGPAGFARGGANVTLAEDGAATLLAYDVDVDIGGKLAQVGARLIDGFARKYADDFFASFARIVSAGASPDDGGSGSAVRPVEAGRSANAPAASPMPVPAPGSRVPAHRPVAQPGRFDPMAFTIVVLAALLVFMTIMFVRK